jgi:hypothetical protein
MRHTTGDGTEYSFILKLQYVVNTSADQVPNPRRQGQLQYTLSANGGESASTLEYGGHAYMLKLKHMYGVNSFPDGDTTHEKVNPPTLP